MIHTKGDSRTAQVVKPGSHLVIDDAGTEIANSVETRSLPMESQPGSALPQPEAMVSRVSRAHLEGRLFDGKQERDGTPVDRSAPAQMDWCAQPLSDDQDSEVRTQWTFPQGQQSSFTSYASFEGAERFSDFWADQQSPQHDQTEAKLPPAAVVDHQVASGQPTELIMAGAHGRAGSGPPPAPPNPPFVSQAQPSMPSQDMAESSVRLMTRSVVFDVAQPELGHVNVRVAMTNDLVHAQLSADRPEVGQFLINGQDRLQAALQANGLDMGLFRVDIDRQGSGRSFQHGQSQEQGQSWNQHSSMDQEHGADRQGDKRASLHGLLNVVA